MFSRLRGSLWGILPVWSGAGAGAILKAVLLTKLVLLHWLMLESLEPCRSSESTCGSHGHAGPSPLVALRRGKMRARLALESDGWWGATRKLVCCTGAGLAVSAVGMMPRSGLRCLLARSLLVLRGRSCHQVHVFSACVGAISAQKQSPLGTFIPRGLFVSLSARGRLY